ncbi:MAG: hypothetical protein IJ600_07055 [Lachnospiraceae bacterium]|nr:hypothetical protein [Lachnospiraceae bacterium]
MKTELIYSKNRHADLDRALEQIALFRQQYRYGIETRRGFGFSSPVLLRNRLRLKLLPGRYGALAAADMQLEKLCEELQQVRELVFLSNTLQELYGKYRGRIDLKLKNKNKKGCLLLISTDGYSDDLGSGGSVRVPAMQREFALSHEDADRIFRPGAVDFSWLDGELSEIERKADTLHAGLLQNIFSTQKALPLHQDLPPFSFETPGDNPGDILD